MHRLTAITGAFGYIGKYIARVLLENGERIVTLTNKPAPDDTLREKIPAYPLDFDQPEALVSALSSVDTLYNTYWVRFNYGQTTFDKAIQNTQTLIHAAKKAGVGRIVHISIANPSTDSNLPYYRGKALLEQFIQQSGLTYAILRPTVVFGLEDVLINNIAFLLRYLPIFAIPGSGNYRLQPIFVEDLAKIAFNAGHSSENQVLDAVGPDIFTYKFLAHLIAEAIGSRSWIIHLPPSMALTLSRLIGLALNDVVLTRDELTGLMADLLVSREPPLGKTSLRDWLASNAEACGTKYASEIRRHFSSP